MCEESSLVETLVCDNLTVLVNDWTNSSRITSTKNISNGRPYSLIPEEALYYIFMFNLWGPGLGVSIFGILTNILNIVTFLKQSVGDAVNISLLGLAISDLGSLLTACLMDICFLPAFIALDLPFLPMDVMYLFGCVHVMLTRVSAWITAYITLERCLCITYPLKVKNIVTPKRTVIYILIMYMVITVSAVPIFYSTRATFVFDLAKNRTLFGITLLTNRGEIETVNFVVNNIVPMSTFIAVIICTIILVKNLRSKSKWRQQSTGAGHLVDRDARVIKMVVFISAVFIVCSAPGTIVYIWMMIDPELRVDGRHWDVFLVNFSTCFFLEDINASVNIFIYFCMSSKFKRTFLQTFISSRWSLPEVT